ncbi:hypothetical protein LTR95_017779 [Oleoguttula sp. CCFEE 5521]
MAAKTHAIPDQTGKVIVVTGGNAGLGAETVRRLAAHNASRIFLCARTFSKAESLITAIKQDHPDAALTPIHMDLASLESVRTAAAQILERTDRIHQLYLNAGIAIAPPGTTQEGYEAHFGVNHVAHALLTQTLMPVMLETSREEAADVRTIVVSSSAAKDFTSKTQGIDFTSVKSQALSLTRFTRYGQSKLANVLFAKKLAQLYPSITSVSLHPGVVRTEVGEKADVPWVVHWTWDNFWWLVAVEVETGAKTQLWAGTGEGVASGKFYVPFGKEMKFRGTEGEELMEELWRWTEKELRGQGGVGWPEEASMWSPRTVEDELGQTRVGLAWPSPKRRAAAIGNILQ